VLSWTEKTARAVAAALAVEYDRAKAVVVKPGESGRISKGMV